MPTSVTVMAPVKQGRHDLRQLGLALVVDRDTQLPLAYVLYEGARSDMHTFAAFLKPVRERLHVLTSQSQQLTVSVRPTHLFLR